MDIPKGQTIVVIGGGVGGCCTALALARTQQFQIYLLEKNGELMRESSDVTPGRMGLGFHYADKETALYYLHATLEFTRKYGRFRQEVGRSETLHPLRRGRYFILKSSLVPVKEILDTYDALKEEYTNMVSEDPSYEVFGRPEDFYRVLEPWEFEEDVATEEIEMGIETAEELLDWSRLRRFIISQLEHFQDKKMVEIRTNTEVTEISALEDCGVYLIKAVNLLAGGNVEIFAEVTVNASWYNIGKFNKMLGISAFTRKICNRIKAITTVQLPEALVHMPSMFFCMGPFGMFSNKGNRVGMLTYAPETNMAVSTSEELEPEFEHIFFNLSEDEKCAKGKKILAGVSKYIPKLKQAKVTNVKLGIIQTFMDEDTIDFGFKVGNLDLLHDPHVGGIYKRNYSGVEEPRPGYIINACMKLLYCFDNAEIVKDLILSKSAEGSGTESN